MHNLKVENSVLFSRHTEDLSQETASQIALRMDYSKGTREEPRYIGVFERKTNTGGENIKRLLLIKENETSQVHEFSAFVSLGG